MMRVRGSWPNPVVLRRGWARADARPWNRSRPDAHLRLVRGSAGFLSAAAEHVLGFGATAVVSPPLIGTARDTWLRAGFVPDSRLRLLRKEIGPISRPDVPISTLAHDRWGRIVAIDAAAFGDRWKAELPALTEALQSASSSTLLGVESDGELAGYAIVAVSGGTGYLQRLAVDPAFQRSGLGRALTRAAHDWARRRGARHIVLNTKPDNTPALDLYLSEGYVLLPERLELLRYPANS